MITAPNTSATGAYFTKAPNGSAFRKVFLNNMDENSFRTNSDHSDSKNQISLMISNSRTALFDTHGRISAVPEYRYCLVSKITIHHGLISSDFIKRFI